MLSTVKNFNKHIEEEKKRDIDLDWRDSRMLLGSDVVSLFPSLSAERTAASVRTQAEKSTIKWENIDVDWLFLYIRLTRQHSPYINEIVHFYPKKRKGRRGVEAKRLVESLKLVRRVTLTNCPNHVGNGLNANQNIRTSIRWFSYSLRYL